jgi:non-reducing end alpha-L-arabinofuranosidase
MNRLLSLACTGFGLVTLACGGLTAIGEGAGGDPGVAGNKTGGGGGVAANGGSGAAGGIEPSGSGGTEMTGSSGGEASGSGGTETGGSGGTGTAGSGGTGTAGSNGTAVGPLPCDVLQNAGHPCVAAHSTVRALVSSYSGPLYQVERSDQATLNIGIVDGLADAAALDEFCSTTCTVTIIYDQSPQGNHLTPAPPGSAKPTPANPASIGEHQITLGGRTAHGLRFRPGQGYRAACDGCPYPTGPAGTAVGDEPQTIYMVTSQHDLINGCCFDYGNGEVTRENDGDGAVEAVYFGSGVIWGSGVPGASGEANGPWVMADLENGLFAGWENNQAQNISTNTPLAYDFVTAIVVGDTADKFGGEGRFALYGGDATSGTLKTMYDGKRPGTGYVPMRKQGSVILSIGGDNSDGDGGRFYEGVMANGAASKETIDALQAAIVAAGYGK